MMSTTTATHTDKLLLLSVPHSVPSNVTSYVDERGVLVTHLADTAALPFAHRLARSVEKAQRRTQRWHVRIREGDRNRIVCDLNRIWCRATTTWRRSLRRDMERASLLIDIHSFPAEHSSLNCYFLIDAGYDALDKAPRRCCSLTDIDTALRTAGITSEVVRGERNDIIDEAYSIGLCAILFEINETNDEQTNDTIAQTITAWLMKT